MLYLWIRKKTIFKKSYEKNIIWLKNEINIASPVILSKCKFNILGNKNNIIIAKSVFLNNVTFQIRWHNNLIKIWPDVAFNNSGSLWIEGEGCEINIGKWTTFEAVHIVASEEKSKVIIGEDCMFAYDIDIRSGDSHSILNTTTMKRINHSKDIWIDNKVWVTPHVSILKGVRIQENSVVATRSVVTKAFLKKWILIWGAPAKVLKENIEWIREKI